MVTLIAGLLVVYLLGVSSVVSGRTIRVAQDGTGDFTSAFAVVEAVRAAQPGDTVQVAEGSYLAGLFLDKPIVLRGAGADKTTLINNTGGLMTVTAEGCIIEGFTLYADEAIGGSFPGEPVVVRCVAASPRIHQNTFRGFGNKFYNVWCEGKASPVIKNNNFYILGKRDYYGVYLKENSTAVSAEENWWGTTDEQEIQEWIWDGADHPGLGLVDYTPWLREPWREKETIVLPVTFGQMKAWFLHNAR